MSYSMTWSIGVEIDGESAAQKTTMTVTARDHIRLSIPAGEEKPDVEIQPTADADRLALLMITASAYGEDLTYQIQDTTDKIPLDTAQLFVGKGALGMLEKTPTKLSFKNDLGTDVTITILVCRNAV